MFSCKGVDTFVNSPSIETASDVAISRGKRGEDVEHLSGT
jgi:hypothetical protein